MTIVHSFGNTPGANFQSTGNIILDIISFGDGDDDFVFAVGNITFDWITFGNGALFGRLRKHHLRFDYFWQRPR